MRSLYVNEAISLPDNKRTLFYSIFPSSWGNTFAKPLIFLLKDLFLLFLITHSCVPAYDHVHYRGQKPLDPLEGDLEMIVSHPT